MSNGRRSSRTRPPPTLCTYGELADLSESGARIRCRRSPRAAVGDCFEFSVANDPSPPIAARVVWVRRTGWFRHEMGIEFLAAPEPYPLPSVAEPSRPLRRSA